MMSAFTRQSGIRPLLGGTRKRSGCYQRRCAKTRWSAYDPIGDITSSRDTASMTPRFLPLVAGLLSLFGCKDPHGPIKTSAGNLTQEQVDAIVADCAGEKGMAFVENSSLTIIQASDIVVTECVLEALQATGETTLPHVDNQRHDATES